MGAVGSGSTTMHRHDSGVLLLWCCVPACMQGLAMLQAKAENQTHDVHLVMCEYSITAAAGCKLLRQTATAKPTASTIEVLITGPLQAQKENSKAEQV